MIRAPLTDPTAGERARQIHDFPYLPQRILDPTDPRFGLTLVEPPGTRVAVPDDAAARRTPDAA